MKLIQEIKYRDVDSEKKLTDITALLTGLAQWAPNKAVPDFYFEVDENEDVVLFANLKMYVGDMKRRTANYFQIETAILDKRRNTVYCLANSEAYTDYEFLNGVTFYERYDFEALCIMHGGDAREPHHRQYHHHEVLPNSFKHKVSP